MTNYKRAGYLLVLVLVLRIAAEFVLPLLWNGQDLITLYALNALIVSLGAVYVPALLFGSRAAETLALRKVSLRTLLWSALLGLGLFQLSTGFNALAQMGFDALGLKNLSLPMPRADGWRLPALVALMALIPAVTEETLFRGALLQSWRPLGRTRSILITSLVFALFHFTPLNIPAILLISWFLGAAAYDSQSVYPSMVIHGMNNLMATLFSVAAAAVPEGMAEEISMGQTLLSIAFFLGWGLVTTLWARWGFRRSLTPLPEPAHEPRGGLLLPMILSLALLIAGNLLMLAVSMGYVSL